MGSSGAETVPGCSRHNGKVVVLEQNEVRKVCEQSLSCRL